MSRLRHMGPFMLAVAADHKDGPIVFVDQEFARGDGLDEQGNHVFFGHGLDEQPDDSYSHRDDGEEAGTEAANDHRVVDYAIPKHARSLAEVMRGS